ncbi:MAG: efflux RND transporter permease subunit [bacterium]|jgi:HAE1 family hydrophobic/amphiphilic exporter-1|nr:efflux RND transporter permease subunit [bacterium]
MDLHRWLPQLSLRRPVTVLMLFTALATLGGIALQRISYEMMPQGFSSPYMGFWVPYPDSTPEEIEELIARPFEENLRTVHGLKHLESNSQAHGCWMWMQFRDGTDMNQAWSQVRDCIDRSLAESSVEIERVVLRRMGMDDEEVYWLGISTLLDPSEARALVEEKLQKPLERLDGVAKVDLWGRGVKEVLIDLDLEALGRHGVNAWTLMQALSRDNVSLSLGPVSEGNRRLALRTDARWRNLEEIAALPVRSAGQVLRLDDLARVHLDVPVTDWVQRVDRKGALMLGVSRESTANTEQLCRQVDEVLARATADPALSELRISTLFSQGRVVRESIDNLKESALWGGLFALGVLFFFLRRWSATLLITAAIPFCMLITMTVIYFAGWSLNVITMMGMMISVGLVVDNAIVVMESIAITAQGAKGADPLSRREAVVRGTAEVSLAVIVATSTTIVVFLPLMLMSGDNTLSFFLTRIGMPVVAALVASLLVALLFIPQLAARLPLEISNREPRLVLMGRRHARTLLAFCLRHRRDATLVALLVLFSTAIPMQRVEKKGEGEGNVGDFRVILDMPASYTLTDADSLVRRLEEIVYAQEERYRIRTVTSGFSRAWGQVHVWVETDARQSWYAHALHELGRRLGLGGRDWLTRDEAVEDLRQRLPKVPGVELRMGWRDFSEETGTTIVVRGPDTDRLKELAEEVRRRLLFVEGVIDAELDAERGQEELVLVLDRDQLSRHGLSASQVAGTVRTALAGNLIGWMQRADRDVPIQLRLAQTDRDQLHKILELEQTGATGKIPLGQVATVRHGRSMGNVKRSQGQTFMRVKVYDRGGRDDAFQGRLRSALADLALPPGYSWGLGRGFDRFQEQEEQQNFALLLALAFVFLLMGMLFESFSMPLVVLASVPFAFFGAWWTLLLSGTPFDIMAGIGLIILVGVVVNNAIVLIDLVARLRREGVPREEALLEAVGRRYRPVIMTALTTVCGLIPMAVGNASLVGMPYAPMGRAMAGGLVASTFFTLIVVPLVYLWVDDARLYLGALFRSRFARRRGA